MWLVSFQYFCSNYTFFFCLSWMFPYLEETYQLGSIKTGLYGSIPLLCGAVGNWVSGAMVDMIYRLGHWNLSRRLPAIFGFVLVLAGLCGIVWATNVTLAIVCLSIAIFGADMTLSPSWSLCIDIGRRNAGAVSGTMNMAGNIGAFITPLAFAYLQRLDGNKRHLLLPGGRAEHSRDFGLADDPPPAPLGGMVMPNLRGVCVGAGYFAKFQYEAWNRIPEVSITAMCNRDPTRGQAIQAEYGVPKRYSDYREMLVAEKPDFVDIITPPETHQEMCRIAAELGIHVICQKPLAPTYHRGGADCGRLAPRLEFGSWSMRTSDFSRGTARSSKLLTGGAIGTQAPFA
jgi:hypothetical protein